VLSAGPESVKPGDIVIPSDWYWVVFVLVAAAFQTVRNATQRTISGTAGTLGGTYASPSPA
jgi:hypothetical protein